MTNREKLQKALDLIAQVTPDAAISPTPFGQLLDAEQRILEAMKFALDMRERDGITVGSR